MDILQRMDREHAEVVAMIPAELLDLSDIPRARQMVGELLATMTADLPPVEGVSSHDHHAPGPDGAPDVVVRVYRPDGVEGDLPGFLWIHGGGMVLGDVAMDDFATAMYAQQLQCVVGSVDYRLAPEHPFPAPLEDCYAALKWFARDCPGVNGSRVIIGGASAGAGLAAGLALLARDRGEIDVAFQLLIYPMIDDRNVTRSSQEITHPSVWNRRANLDGWNAYLSGNAGGDDVSAYAAPARAETLDGLPPAYIAVGDLDLFLDEDIAYAQRLLAAGVPTELHVYPGAFHGSDAFVPMSDISQRWAADRNRALMTALHG
ncbi:MAG: alpha/beta hydrolase [Acidimicrobiia bacterium]|nr:alpha/beta hydrolase [Acidimicrobiia bacterium]